MLWLTDLHLDRANVAAREALHRALQLAQPSMLLVTGDISNATRLVSDLETLARTNAGPCYFVLGNHDHFGGSVGSVRDSIIELAERIPALQWLPRAGVVRLDGDTALVGVDGWADGRHGEALTTPLVLNDDRLIAELAAQPTRLGKLQVKRVLADADADRLAVLLDRAVAGGARRVIVATHVPPFIAAIRPGSRADHPDWYPILVCGATGGVLQRFADAHASVEITVLCGHTHMPHRTPIGVNLGVQVGRPRELRVIGEW